MVLNKLEMLSEIPLRMNNKTEQVYTSKIYVSMTISNSPPILYTIMEGELLLHHKL